jgi:hypothetical protein
MQKLQPLKIKFNSTLNQDMMKKIINNHKSQFKIRVFLIVNDLFKIKRKSQYKIKVKNLIKFKNQYQIKVKNLYKIIVRNLKKA